MCIRDSVIGAMLGSVFIAWLGFKGSVIVNIFTYLVSFAFVFMINKNLKTLSENNSDYLDDLKTGFLYIKNYKREILNLLLFFAVLNFFVSPILILIPVIIKFILIKDVKWLAISESFFALGVLLASFLMSFKKDIKGNISLLIYTIFSFSLFFSFTALSKNPYLTSFFLLVCGFSISVGNVAVVSYFQYNIENEYKGRFFSLVNTVVYAIMPISFVVNGIMIDRLSPQTVILLNSFFSFTIGLFGFFRFGKL
ncbi:MAG: MFS transporter, partial [Elusimicrobiales bacterium]|nr:MFS transporter [Elusimicrobiales bacterium]